MRAAASQPVSKPSPSGPSGQALQRCPTCRAKIVLADADGLVIRNAVLRIDRLTGAASAKCPRCKGWVAVPLAHRGPAPAPDTTARA
jgi:hypothetical protein